MEAFHFPLQTALDVRKRKEEAAQQRFVLAQKQYTEAQRHLQHLRRLLANAETTARRDGQAVDVHALINFDGYQRQMEERIRRQEQVCQQAQTELEAARCELMEASRERQVLDRLKENSHDDYRQAAAQLESRALDEAGTLGYNRTSGLPPLSFGATNPFEAA